MPRLFTTSSDNLVATSTTITAKPAWQAIWVKRHAPNTNGGLYAALYAASNQLLGVGEDVSGNSGKPIVYIAAGSNTGQVKAAVAVAADTWTHVAASESTAEMDVWVNGGNKGNAVGGATPSTLTGMRINNAGTALASISMAGYAVGNTLLTDLEAAALGAGLDPRHVKSAQHFYLINTASGTESDLIGTIGMTITGTSAASDAPPVSTYMTGGPVGNQSWTTGTAITSIDLSTSGGVFTDTASPYTVTLQQISATGTTGLTSSSGTTTRTIALTATMSGLAAGDYVTVGANPAVRVLAVSGSSFLVASDQTYASSSTVTRYSVGSLSIPGIAITSNVISGTPTAAATYALCVGRATCNASGSAIADTNTFSITISSSGGGGGGGGTGLMQAALGFTGGFQGG